MATPNKNLAQPAHNSDVDTWDQPLNTNFGLIDTALGGLTQLNVVGQSGVVTLTSDQYTPPNLVAIGAMTADVNYQLPVGVGGVWQFLNATSGAYTLTFSASGGSVSVNIPQGYSGTVVSDGQGNTRFGNTLPGIASQIIPGSFSGLGNGYIQIPFNTFEFIVQWGMATSSGTSSPNVTITFPIEFPTICLSLVGWTSNVNFIAAAESFGSGPNDTTGFANVASTSGALTSGINVFWLAVGY